MSRNPRSDRRLSAQPLHDRHDDPRQDDRTGQGATPEQGQPPVDQPPQRQRTGGSRASGQQRQSNQPRQRPRRNQQTQQTQPAQQRQPAQQNRQTQQPQQPGHTRQARQAAGTGIRAVEEGDRYVHVQFRDPDAFDVIRTPDWAARAAQDLSPGAEVRTGKVRGSDEWHTESVLVPKPVDAATAMELADRIVAKIGE